MLKISNYNTGISVYSANRNKHSYSPQTRNAYNSPAFSGGLKSAAAILGEISAKQNSIKKITIDEIEKLEDFYSYFDRDFLIRLGIGKCFGNDNIEKIFKNLIRNTDDVVNFVSLMAEQKPSIILDNPVKALLETGSYNGFDVVSQYTPAGKCVNSFILNPKLCKQIIEKYRTLFISKMMLPSQTSVDEIYNRLAKQDSVLFKGDFCFSDITGMLLGYPVKNSLLFNLEAMLPLCKYRDFSHILLHQRELQFNLAHKNYSLISPEVKQMAISAIKEYDGSVFNKYNLSELPNGSIPGIKYISHIREPEEEKRLITAFRKTLEKFEEIITEKENSLSQKKI